MTTGSYQGHTAPTKPYSKLIAIPIHAQQTAHITLDMVPDFEYEFEYGMLIIEGSASFHGQHYFRGQRYIVLAAL